MKKKLIEVALPLEAINAASAHEKGIRHGHPSTLHLWWARRPLAACRAVLFASLVDDPSSDPERFPTAKAVDDERRRLFRIIEELVPWENSSDDRILGAARDEILRATHGEPPPVFDPFCGGGSIPLEAQRLGLQATGSDLNPVAVLITRALIEIPPRFANRPPVHPEARRGVGASGDWRGAAGLAEDVRRYGVWMRDEAARRIGHLYPRVQLSRELGGGEETAIAWIWARTITCPNPACRSELPLARSFALATKRGTEAYINPVVDPNARSITYEVRYGAGDIPQAPKIGRGATFRCLVCGDVAPETYVKQEGLAGRMGSRLMAVVTEAATGRLFVSPSSFQERTALSASPEWAPTQELAINPRAIWCVAYGLTEFKDLFTARQLVALETFAGLVPECRERVRADALSTMGSSMADQYADGVATYLAFAVSRLADRHSSLCVWDPNPSGYAPKVSNTFGRQAIPMKWDYAEANPFSHSTGNAADAFNWVAEVVDRVPTGQLGIALQQDATAATNLPLCVVATDPPYYDNIGYAELADFFYVWLRRALSEVYPDLFQTMLTPKADELVATPYRFGGSKKKAEEFFEHGLGQAFEKIRAIADPTYPITIFYAFKQAESGTGDREAPAISTGWETMLEGLLRSGWMITGTWPVRTELTTSLKKGISALASSVVLVCRPRPKGAAVTDRRDFVTALKMELPDALRTLQRGNIAPVDLAQAAIGPGMGVFSRFAKVVEPDGRPMVVRSALSIINSVLGEVLSEQEDEFDADTRWAVTWFEQYRHGPAEFDRATVLARARGVGINGLQAAGIVESKGGRVRLLPRADLDPTWDPTTDKRLTVWEVVQHLILALDDGGEPAAADLVRRVGGLADSARDLAYRLYSISERKRWADEALGYNRLVTSWPEITRLAASTPGSEPPQQAQLFS